MSKKKPKKKKRIPVLPSPDTYNPGFSAAAAELKESAKRFKWKLAGIMLAIFAVLCTVYFVLLRLYVFWASPVLYTVAAVLFLAFFFVNRGFSRETPPRDALPDTWSEQQKDKYLENDFVRKTFAKNIMVVLVPVFGVVMVDMVILFVLPVFTS